MNAAYSILFGIFDSDYDAAMCETNSTDAPAPAPAPPTAEAAAAAEAAALASATRNTHHSGDANTAGVAAGAPPPQPPQAHTSEAAGDGVSAGGDSSGMPGGKAQAQARPLSSVALQWDYSGQSTNHT